VIVGHVAYAGVSAVAAFTMNGSQWVACEASMGAGAATLMVREMASQTSASVRLTALAGEAPLPSDPVGSAYATLVVPTTLPESVLSQEYSSACRRALRRFDASECSVDCLVAGGATEAIGDALVPFEAGPEFRDGMEMVAFRSYILALLEHGAAAILVLRWRERVTAVAILLIGRDIINLRYSTTTRVAFPESVATRAGNGLVASSIRFARRRGMRWLDLSGLTLGALDGHPSGIDRFKMGFGNRVWLFREFRFP